MSKGYVYFVRDKSGYIKIGRTNRSPDLRLKELEHKFGPLEVVWLISGAHREREMHDRFWMSRFKSEWFFGDVCDELLRSIP